MTTEDLPVVIYDDGREGHRGVRGVVLESDDVAMMVQWEDRAAPSRVAYDDEAWTKHMRFA